MHAQHIRFTIPNGALVFTLKANRGLPWDNTGAQMQSRGRSRRWPWLPYHSVLLQILLLPAPRTLLLLLLLLLNSTRTETTSIADGESNNQGHCTSAWSCTQKGAKGQLRRYLLYTVNSGEGFNLARDVFLRVAALASSLQESRTHERWTVVLPPFNSPHVGDRNVPW